MGRESTDGGGRTRRVTPSARATAVAAFALALTACSGGDGADTRSPDAPGASGTTVVVYAAASLGDVFDDIAAEFESAHPDVAVEFSLGGSSALAEQLRQGAPGDAFAPASVDAMADVIDAGLVANHADVFATNTLQIAVPPGNPGGVTGLEDLERSELVVALCAPEVPCGAASEALLQNAGVTAKPDTLEQDVRAAMTKVELGEVDAALVYTTDVLRAGDAAEGIDAVGAESVVNSYPIAVLRDARSPTAARAFVDFVLSARAATILKEAGFGPA